MSNYTLFHNPMSRALIAQWALLEVDADFELANVEWADKPQALLDANPMGKIPTLIHHAPFGDVVVSEGAAICHYVADAEKSALLPTDSEKAAYFRWLFFAAGPADAAVTNKSMGWIPTQEQQGTVGYGSYDRTMNALGTWLAEHDFVCGERFTMADVYVGSQVDWGLRFGTMPDLPALRAYQARVMERPAYGKTMGAIPS